MIASDLTALLVCYEHNDNSPQQVMLRVLGTLVLLYQVKPLFEGVFSSSTCYPSPPPPPGAVAMVLRHAQFAYLHVAWSV